MFINCPDCSALVATNLATGLPPQRCPRCGFGPLAPEAAATTAAPASSAPPEPGSERPQPDKVVFIPLTPSRPAQAVEGDEPSGASVEPAPDGAEAAAPEPQPQPAAELRPEPARAPQPPPQPAPTAPEPPEPPEPPVDPVAAEPPTPPARPAPRFLARAAGATQRGGDRRLVAMAAGLAALLVVQLLLADRARLATDTGGRPVVAALCAVLRCSLPAWREPAAIAVEQRDVRPVPGRPGVLRASATIRNDGRWAQAWPRLVLTLSDVDGRALGMRAFEPAEYLAAPPQDVTIARGESASLLMDIVEPSPHAVAFNFGFE
ncbi:MAG: DUF3426 domain-containing protein [Gammaproteobacteria bacterium]|nr:DUF3426 domain-containing protein [Gammaproteobacteria bacterium]